MARQILTGQPGSPGLGLGRVLWLASDAGSTASAVAPRAIDAATERTRLLDALEAAATELSELATETASRAGEEVGAIFEAQALFARDPGIVEPALAAIADGASAAEAIERVAAELADRLAGVDDEYFRERAADLRDVARRVADRLIGRNRPELHRRDGAPAVVAAADLEPSIVAVIRPELVAGLALTGGAPNGHAAIIARALGMPLVLGLGSALNSGLDGIDVAVDGTDGRLFVEPDEADIRALAGADAMAPTGADAIAAIGIPRPGSVSVEANVGSVREAEAAAAAGADGVGLVRTELLFLGRSSPPGLDEQRAIYGRIARSMAGRPVVFRTLDIGGDKPAPYLAQEPEMNPALGVRGVRLGLHRPDLMRTQFRALLEAAPELPLRVLLPMVSSVEEVVAARRAIDDAASASIAGGAAVAADVQLGIMVEVPAVAIAADAFAPLVDFFSIGTNDLVQYTLAADRTNPALAELSTPLQPAILRLVKLVVEAARGHGRSVAVCGEAAADPLAGPLFVGLGVDQLSVAPAAIGAVRTWLAALDPTACREAANRALEAGSLAQVRRIATELVARGPATKAALPAPGSAA